MCRTHPPTRNPLTYLGPPWLVIKCRESCFSSILVICVCVVFFYLLFCPIPLPTYLERCASRCPSGVHVVCVCPFSVQSLHPPVPCSYDIPTTLVSDPLFPFLDHILCMRPSDGLTHCSPPPSPLRVLHGPWRWGLGERRRSSGLDPRVALALPLWSGHPGMTLLARLLEIERIPIAALNLRSAALESRPPNLPLPRHSLGAASPRASMLHVSTGPPSKSLRAPSVFRTTTGCRSWLSVCAGRAAAYSKYPPVQDQTHPVKFEPPASQYYIWIVLLPLNPPTQNHQ